MTASDVFGLPTTFLSSIGAVTIDAVIREQHRFENLVTKHPVEDGSPRTDNIINLPVKLEMEGRITDTPMSFVLSAASGAAGLLGEALGIDAAAVALGTSLIGATMAGRAKAAYQELVALYTTRIPFEVQSGINLYENMVFETLVFPRIKEDGRSIRFRATMVEILIVGSSSESNAQRIAAEVENTALDPDNLGAQPTTEFTGAAL